MQLNPLSAAVLSRPAPEWRVCALWELSSAPPIEQHSYFQTRIAV